MLVVASLMLRVPGKRSVEARKGLVKDSFVRPIVLAGIAYW